MKRVFSLFVIVALLLSVIPKVGMAETDRQSGAFFYRIKGNGTAVITGYDWDNHQNEDIYIPRMLDGYTVTEIGEEAFTRLQYNENGVIKANYHATAKSLTIPDTVLYIGDKAFMNTRFVKSSITIPASVQYIGAGAFSNLVGIEQFVVDAGNPVYATINGVLYNKQQKELVAYPPAKQLTSSNGKPYQITIPEGILSIGDYAMFGIGDVKSSYGLNYNLPSTLKHIGDYAFAHNSGFAVYRKYEGYRVEIETICFPDALETIGIGAFYDIEGDDTPHYIDLSNTQITEIPELAFYNCRVSDGILFPETLTRIGDKAFKNCEVFFEIQKFPSSLKYIGNEAFAYSEFAGISFPKNSALISIGNSAFEGCKFCSDATGKGTSNIVLPNNLESIGENAFWNCKSLKQLTIPDSVRKIGDNMCDRNSVYLDVTAGTYAALWASENGYTTQQAGQEDTSWLTD